ncbi:trans-sulfuration enzyme family protein [Geminicoccus flavidas]|uniref:trans-sulfuration enzyme family protein n=1 Tax=Geminicoccus flavidas TaxID=2506407 RepID=UPI0013586AE4|nr:PLP-dependent aspartate aminotransferase family protein [Geminicoccus flavidas]
MADSASLGDATLSLHGGAEDRRVGAPAAPPPVLSTSFFTHPNAVGFAAAEIDAATPHFYTRWSNPTLQLLETRLAALEGGEAAVSFASGMAAVTALFLDRLRAGDHLILSEVCYAGVAELAHAQLAGLGIRASFVDTSDLDAVAAAFRPDTKLVHVETPANPTLRITDIAAVAELARARGVPLSVDSTIATPLGTRPLPLGADYVIHSLTKYLCGHGDALGGAVITSAERAMSLRKESLIHLGGSLSPFAAWLIMRGMETLAPRMALHESNARRLEAWLAEHPKVARVLWPGSPRHPQHELARRQMRNFSSLLSFTLKEDNARMARQVAERLRVISPAVSLGKTKSLLFYIPTDDIISASWQMGEAAAGRYRALAGEGVFRFSVGLEDADDLIADLDQALA